MQNQNLNKNLLNWAKDLFPINRSLTGDGNLQTLKYLKKINPLLKIKKTKTGTKCFDWKVPYVWNVKRGMLTDNKNKLICDFKRNNLELIGYSSSIKKEISLKQLKSHLFTLKNQPEAIPYVTSYYKKNWGFCIKYNDYKKLKKNIKYKVQIETKHEKGFMYHGEIFLKGKSKKEILICTYICHPSMANNELSGILASIYLSKILKYKNNYSIRILFIPETIGAINFINKYNKHLKENLITGINLTCVGLNGPYTIISSIKENTYADIICKRIGRTYKNFRILNFLERGSNERQFGCQNLNLPFVTFCRKKFGEYKEYHTSLDNLKILNYKEIINSTIFIKKIIDEINNNEIYIKLKNCEPFFTKYKMIKALGTKKNMQSLSRVHLSNFVAYTCKDLDVKEIQKKCKIKNTKIKKIVQLLSSKKIIKKYI